MKVNFSFFIDLVDEIVEYANSAEQQFLRTSLRTYMQVNPGQPGPGEKCLLESGERHTWAEFARRVNRLSNALLGLGQREPRRRRHRGPDRRSAGAARCFGR